MLDKEIVVTSGELKVNFVRGCPGPAQNKGQAAVPQSAGFSWVTKAALGSSAVCSFYPKLLREGAALPGAAIQQV